MKNDLTPTDHTGEEDELSVPMLLPVQKKHYLIALIIVLALCVVLLSIVLATSASQAAPSLPQDQADTPDASKPSPTPAPSEQEFVPSTPSDQQTPDPTPEQSADTPPSPEPMPTPNSPQPEPTDQSTPATAEPPTIVVEQILLSGSAGLVYRSYGNGSCIVEGIGSCTDTCLIIPTRSPDGDTVIAIDQGAFVACNQLLAVQIPATVKNIGKYAFSDCSSLLLFSVDPQNPAYCAQSGVLYSKDMTSLLCYPAGRPCPTATIPASVTYISAKAFDTSAQYSSITFEGTLSAWRSIHIEEDNHILYTLPKQFAPS